MAYVTYYHARPAGLPAASTLRRVAAVFATAPEAAARAAANVVETNVAVPVSDDVDVGWWIQTAAGATLGAVSAALPEGTVSAAAARTAAWRRRLHDAWRAYVAGDPSSARQDWWPRVSGSAQALVATDRWAFSQIALGDVIAGGGVATLNSTPLREGAVAHIETAISTLGRTWYRVMVADADKRGDWAGGSVAANSRIYSDLFSNVYALRAADGTWTQLAARVPAGFEPDSPTLR